MLGYPEETVWVRYTWTSSAIGAAPAAPIGFGFRDAVEGEADAVIGIAIDAYTSDPVWHEMMPGIRLRMTRRVVKTFASTDARFAVAFSPEGNLVGCSGVVVEHPTGQNFLTGICVLPQHQRRGIGRRLLWESLDRLRELAVAEPVVYTERGSIADRFIYPLFNSRRVEGVVYPAAALVEAGGE